MPLLDKIFGRVDVLKVSFPDSSGYSCTLLKCRFAAGELTEQEKEENVEPQAALAKNNGIPCVIAFCGYGIISKQRKELPAKLLEKIEGDGDEFLWNEDGSEVITLLRREQTAGFEEAVSKAKAPVIGKVVCASPADEELLADCARLLKRVVNFKSLVKPDDTGSGLCRVVFHKSKLAVLGLILVVLVANYFRNETVQAEYSKVQMELQASQRAVGAAGELDRQKSALVEKYNRHIPHGFSWICDRIAIVLPQSMQLTSLKVQPVTKKVENGKEVIFNERRIEIAGNASNTEDIMIYISALTKLRFAKDVKMVSIEQERNSADLQFNLLLTL